MLSRDKKKLNNPYIREDCSKSSSKGFLPSHMHDFTRLSKLHMSNDFLMKMRSVHNQLTRNFEAKT